MDLNDTLNRLDAAPVDRQSVSALEDALAASRSGNLKEVLVIGLTRDGGFYMIGGTLNLRNVVFLLNLALRRVLDMAQRPAQLTAAETNGVGAANA